MQWTSKVPPPLPEVGPGASKVEVPPLQQRLGLLAVPSVGHNWGSMCQLILAEYYKKVVFNIERPQRL